MSAGPSTATGPTWNGIPIYVDPAVPDGDVHLVTLAGAGLTPPPPSWTVTASADPLPDLPSAAEIAAVRALPLDARYALCACRGPGWTVHPDGSAVPRLRPPSVAHVGTAVLDAWLPAAVCDVVDLVASCWGVGRRHALAGIAEGVDAATPLRLAALRTLARCWR